MKKLIYFFLFPIFLFAQIDLSNINLGLISSLQKDFVVSNYFNDKAADNKLRTSIGLNLGYKFLSQKLKCGIEIQFFTSSKYTSTSDEYFPEFAGVATPNAGGVLEIIGGHEAYTLTQFYEVEQPRLLSFYISYNVVDNFSVTIVPYYSKLSFFSQNEEWGSTLTYETINGVVNPVVTDQVFVSRQQAGEMKDNGINLGFTYEYNNFIFDFRIPVYNRTNLDVVDVSYSGSPIRRVGIYKYKKPVIFSIGYTIL